MEKTWRQRYKCGIEWRMFLWRTKLIGFPRPALGEKRTHEGGFLTTRLTGLVYNELALILHAVCSCRNDQRVLTGQKSNYPPANHHAVHLKKCSISRSWPPANHLCWWPFTLTIILTGVWEIIKVTGQQHQWLALLVVSGNDLEIGHF